MINQITITKDMLEITEKNFYEGRINPVLYEDIALVFTTPTLFKLFKYKKGVVHMARMRGGIAYALRYLYDSQSAQNMSTPMRSQVSNVMLNTIITAIENKAKEQFPVKQTYKIFDVNKGEFDVVSE